jgi:DNA-binding transcriptional MocR family regulator
MQFTIRRDAETPIYRQIVDQVRAGIATGDLPRGARLPPVRQLALDCGVTRLTVHSAYAELQAEGLLESYVGRGTFVASTAETLPAPSSKEPIAWEGRSIVASLMRHGDRPGIISFVQAFPARETYPVSELEAALHEAMADPDVLGYGHTQGDPLLRAEVATLLAQRGITASPDDLLVTAGAQQAIDLILRAFTAPGDVLLVEEPTYPGVLELATRSGQRVVGIPNDDGALRIHALEAACLAERARLLYLVPTFSNPTGRSLDSPSREAVLRIAARHDLLVVEDDTYGFMPFDRPASPALRSLDVDGRVLTITSFSKMLAPALRLGTVVARGDLLASLATVKGASDLVCSAVLQRALALYLRAGHLPGHSRRTAALYAERRDALLGALERHMPGCTWMLPEGGLNLWLTLPGGIDEAGVANDALAAGVAVTPGAAFFPRRRPHGSFRLSYGALDPDRIEEGIALLARVLQDHLRMQGRVAPFGAGGPLV